MIDSVEVTAYPGGKDIIAPEGTPLTPFGRFLGPCDVRILRDNRGRTRAVLLQELVFDPPINEDRNPDDPNGYWRVPAGFDFDGASIPRGPARWYAGDPLEADNVYAAAVHDWCRWSYRETGKPALARGDRLLYYGLRAMGKPERKARLMQFFVRAAVRFK